MVVKYEQPDWLEGEAVNDSGKVTFMENSNGRLPLFVLVSMHENRTEVLIELPEGIDLKTVKLESRGGFVHIEDTAHEVQIKTYSGNIYVYAGRNQIKPGIRSQTKTGYIMLEEQNVGITEAGNTSYVKTSENGKGDILIETTRGYIFIK